MKVKLFIISIAAVFISLSFGCARYCATCGSKLSFGRPPQGANAVITTTINGSVSCLDRITMLPTFELTVRLQDMNKSGKEAVVAEQYISNFKSFPVRFNLEFTTSELIDDSSYGLSAVLSSQGVPLFATDTVYPVVTSERIHDVDMVIVRIRD